MKCSLKDGFINILLILFITPSEGVDYPLFWQRNSLQMPMTFRGLSASRNFLQDLDSFPEDSGMQRKVHKIVKKQMAIPDYKQKRKNKRSILQFLRGDVDSKGGHRVKRRMGNEAGTVDESDGGRSLNSDFGGELDNDLREAMLNLLNRKLNNIQISVLDSRFGHKIDTLPFNALSNNFDQKPGLNLNNILENHFDRKTDIDHILGNYFGHKSDVNPINLFENHFDYKSETNPNNLVEHNFDDKTDSTLVNSLKNNFGRKLNTDHNLLSDNPFMRELNAASAKKPNSEQILGDSYGKVLNNGFGFMVGNGPGSILDEPYDSKHDNDQFKSIKNLLSIDPTNIQDKTLNSLLNEINTSKEIQEHNSNSNNSGDDFSYRPGKSSSNIWGKSDRSKYDFRRLHSKYPDKFKFKHFGHTVNNGTGHGIHSGIKPVKGIGLDNEASQNVNNFEDYGIDLTTGNNPGDVEDNINYVMDNDFENKEHTAVDEMMDDDAPEQPVDDTALEEGIDKKIENSFGSFLDSTAHELLDNKYFPVGYDDFKENLGQDSADLLGNYYNLKSKKKKYLSHKGPSVVLANNNLLMVLGYDNPNQLSGDDAKILADRSHENQVTDSFDNLNTIPKNRLNTDPDIRVDNAFDNKADNTFDYSKAENVLDNKVGNAPDNSVDNSNDKINKILNTWLNVGSDGIVGNAPDYRMDNPMSKVNEILSTWMKTAPDNREEYFSEHQRGSAFENDVNDNPENRGGDSAEKVNEVLNSWLSTAPNRRVSYVPDHKVMRNDPDDSADNSFGKANEILYTWMSTVPNSRVGYVSDKATSALENREINYGNNYGKMNKIAPDSKADYDNDNKVGNAPSNRGDNSIEKVNKILNTWLNIELESNKDNSLDSGIGHNALNRVENVPMRRVDNSFENKVDNDPNNKMSNSLNSMDKIIDGWINKIPDSGVENSDKIKLENTLGNEMAKSSNSVKKLFENWINNLPYGEVEHNDGNKFGNAADDRMINAAKSVNKILESWMNYVPSSRPENYFINEEKSFPENKMDDAPNSVDNYLENLKNSARDNEIDKYLEKLKNSASDNEVDNFLENKEGKIYDNLISTNHENNFPENIMNNAEENKLRSNIEMRINDYNKINNILNKKVSQILNDWISDREDNPQTTPESNVGNALENRIKGAPDSEGDNTFDSKVAEILGNWMNKISGCRAQEFPDSKIRNTIENLNQHLDNLIKTVPDNRVGNDAYSTVSNIPENTQGSANTNRESSFPDSRIINSSDNDKVGNAPNNKVGNAPNNKVGNAPNNKVGNAADNKVGNAPNNKVGNAPNNKVGNAADNKVGSNFENKIISSPNNRLSNAGDKVVSSSPAKEIGNSQTSVADKNIKNNYQQSGPPNQNEVGKSNLDADKGNHKNIKSEGEITEMIMRRLKELAVSAQKFIPEKDFFFGKKTCNEAKEEKEKKICLRLPDQNDIHCYYECEQSPYGCMKLRHFKCPEGEFYSLKHMKCLKTCYWKNMKRKRGLIISPMSAKKIDLPDPNPEDLEPSNEWLDATQGGGQKIPAEFKPMKKPKLKIYHLKIKRMLHDLVEGKKIRKRQMLDNSEPPHSRTEKKSALMPKDNGRRHCSSFCRHHPRSFVIRINKKEGKHNREGITENDDNDNDGDNEEGDEEEDEDEDPEEDDEEPDEEENTEEDTEKSTEKMSRTESIKEFFRSAKAAVTNRARFTDPTLPSPDRANKENVSPKSENSSWKSKKSNEASQKPKQVLLDANIKVDSSFSSALKNMLKSKQKQGPKNEGMNDSEGLISDRGSQDQMDPELLRTYQHLTRNNQRAKRYLLGDPLQMEN